MLWIIGLLVFLGLYYLYTSRASLIYQPTTLNKAILAKCHYLTDQWFFYTPFLFNGFLQSAYAAQKLVPQKNLRFKRVNLEFGEDFGNQMALDWGYLEGVLKEEDADQPKGRPILIVLSGLTASKAERYIIDFFQHACKETKWRVVLYNDRLYNNRFFEYPDRASLPQKGYMNYVEDFRRVLERIHQTYPDSVIYAIGFSFGSNTLSRFLGICASNGTKHPIRAGVSICNPFDFQYGIKFLEDGIAEQYIRTHRQRILKEKISQYNPPPKHIEVDYEKAFAAKTAYEFDYEFTRRIFNAPSNDYHFMSVTCMNMLDYINIPMLFLGCRDDPIIHDSVTPYQVLHNNPNFITFVTQVGGHIGQFEGLVPKRWYSKPILQYINAMIDLQE